MRYSEIGESTLPYLLRLPVDGGIELVAQLQVRYPSVPMVFADSRKLAEDWTHRFLGAAAAHHRA
jgi:hypothetical protein